MDLNAPSISLDNSEFKPDKASIRCDFGLDFLGFAPLDSPATASPTPISRGISLRAPAPARLSVAVAPQKCSSQRTRWPDLPAPHYGVKSANINLNMRSLTLECADISLGNATICIL